MSPLQYFASNVCIVFAAGYNTAISSCRGHQWPDALHLATAEAGEAADDTKRWAKLVAVCGEGGMGRSYGCLGGGVWMLLGLVY